MSLDFGDEGVAALIDDFPVPARLNKRDSLRGRGAFHGCLALPARQFTCTLKDLGLPEPLDGAARVVGQREHFVELDLRMHAVALDDPGEPRTAVERLRVIESCPLIDAAGPAALAPDEVFADQAAHLLEIGCDLVKVLSAGCVVDMRRQ